MSVCEALGITDIIDLLIKELISGFLNVDEVSYFFVFIHIILDSLLFKE